MKGKSTRAWCWSSWKIDSCLCLWTRKWFRVFSGAGWAICRSETIVLWIDGRAGTRRPRSRARRTGVLGGVLRPARARIRCWWRILLAVLPCSKQYLYNSIGIRSNNVRCEFNCIGKYLISLLWFQESKWFYFEKDFKKIDYSILITISRKWNVMKCNEINFLQ